MPCFDVSRKLGCSTFLWTLGLYPTYFLTGDFPGSFANPTTLPGFLAGLTIILEASVVTIVTENWITIRGNVARREDHDVFRDDVVFMFVNGDVFIFKTVVDDVTLLMHC